MLSQVIFMLSSQSLKCTVPQNENPYFHGHSVWTHVKHVILQQQYLSFVDVKIILLFLQPTSSPVAVWYLFDITRLIISLILHVIWYSFGPENFEREIHACWYHVTDLKNILRICKRRGGGLTRVMKLNKRPMGHIAHLRNNSTQ